MEGNPSSTQVEPVKFQGERSKFRPALDKFQRSRIKFQAELGSSQPELDRFPLELGATRLGKRPSQPRNTRKRPRFILLPFPPPEAPAARHSCRIQTANRPTKIPF